MYKGKARFLNNSNRDSKIKLDNAVKANNSIKKLYGNATKIKIKTTYFSKVIKVENEGSIVKIGGIECILPKSEIPDELLLSGKINLNVGDTIPVAVLNKVYTESGELRIIVSKNKAKDKKAIEFWY